MDASRFLSSHRKKALFAPADLRVPLGYERPQIEQVVPHRPPFLLLDKLTHFDPERAAMAGELYIREDDPVFAGHFPGDPIYPGSLQIEALGQLATALMYFMAAGSPQIDPVRPLPQVRAIKVLGALFLEAVRPGAVLTLLGSRLEWDGFLACFAGQALTGGKVACVLAGELYVA